MFFGFLRKEYSWIATTAGGNGKVFGYPDAFRKGLPEVSGKSYYARIDAMSPGMAEFLDPTVWLKSFEY